MDSWIPYLKDPLILTGFVTFLLVRLAAKLLSSDKIPTLTRKAGSRVFERLLLALSFIAILIVILGFALRFYELSRGEDFSATVGEKLGETHEVIKRESQKTRDLIESVYLQATKLPTEEEAEKIISADLDRRLESERKRFTRASIKYKAGLRNFHHDELDKARENFQSAIQIVPDFVAALIGLGKTYSQLEKVELAKKTYLEARDFSSEQGDERSYADVLLKLAYLEKENNPKLAQAYIDEVEPIVKQLNDIELLIQVKLYHRPPQGQFRDQLFWLVDMIYLLKLKSNHPVLIANSMAMESALSSLGDYLETGSSIFFNDIAHIDYLDLLRLVERPKSTVFDEPSKWDYGHPGRDIAFNMLFEFAMPGEFRQQVGKAQARLILYAIKNHGAMNLPGSEKYLQEYIERQEAIIGKTATPGSARSEKDLDTGLDRARSLEDEFTILIEEAPQESDLRFLRGRLRFLQWDLENAKTDFDQAILLSNTNDAAYFYRALLNSVRGNMEDAYADFIQSLQPPPDWRVALLKLHKLQRANQRQQLRSYIENLFAKNPHNVQVRLASLYYVASVAEFNEITEQIQPLLHWRPDLRAIAKNNIQSAYESIQENENISKIPNQ